MCLDILSNKVNKKSHIADLAIEKDGYICMWKVFDVDKDDNLVAQFHNYNFYEGKNTARGKIILNFDGDEARVKYEPGFHCFKDEEEAANWSQGCNNDSGRERVTYPIKVKREWITSVGSQGWRRVFVCKHIFI
jgi:hypothetical protein